MLTKRKIIDAHVHWWDLDKNYYPWLCDNQGDRDALYGKNTLSRNFLPEHYLQDAAKYDVQGAVHIQADWDPTDVIGETKWLASLAAKPQKSGLPFAIVPYVNLADKEAEALLKQQLVYPKVRGIRQMLNYMPENPDYCWAAENYLTNPQWLKNFALLEKYQLNFDLMCFSHQMPKMAELAKKHPKVTIILEHCGMPINTAKDLSNWRTGIELLAKQSNVFCKLGGLGTMIPDWDETITHLIFEHLIKQFGSERLLFATNYPTDTVFKSFESTLSIWENVLSTLTSVQQEDIYLNNAKRVYRL